MTQIAPTWPDLREPAWYSEFIAAVNLIVGQGNASDAVLNTGRLSTVSLAAIYAGFAPLTHAHAIADTTGLQAALDGKQPSGSYAAATHGHAIADTTGLQAALDGKQAAGSYATSGHSHAITDTTGLQAALDARFDKSLIELKGDLLAGTGNDAVARVAAGSNGQVLTFDDTVATGMKWATPTGGGGSSAWGGITGTLSAQTDLQTALDAKNKFIVGIGAPVGGQGSNGDYYFDKSGGNLHFKSGGSWALETTFIADRAPLASPTFTGDPKAPTPATGDNDTSIATTAFVKAQGYATLASPVLTGNPTAPTPTAGDNDTSIATTAFVQAAKVDSTVAEFVRDTMGTALVAGANVTITPNDAGDQITVAASGGGGSGPSNQAYLWRNPAGIVSGNVRVGAVTKDGDERWLYVSSGRAFFYPAYYESTFGINGLGVSLRGSDASATVHCSFYSAHGTSGLPNTVLATSTVSAASSGWKNMDITAVTGLASGWYWHSVLPVGGAGLDIHGGWMIHPTDASNMENGIRHQHWNGFMSVSSALSSPPTLPSIEAVNGVLPYMAVRFN